MAAPASSVKSVVVALIGNSFVTVIKLAAFVMSGSGAMLSEGIHSEKDAGCGQHAEHEELATIAVVELVVGLASAALEPEEEQQLVASVRRGCGITIYHGVESLLHPTMPMLDGFRARLVQPLTD